MGDSVIPMFGVECGRCGYPAARVEEDTREGRRGRMIVHLDHRRPPCPAPMPVTAR
jgi:hypothetical protein